jgi:thiamine-monophosphate kinase
MGTPDLDEFDLIARLFRPLTAGRPEALGLADDVALIDGPSGEQWAMTADAIVAGVHFFPDDPAGLIARKLLRVNLSDLAAKGAEPRFALLTCCFPADVGSDWLAEFAAGLQSDCALFGLAVIGGDTVATPGPLCLGLTAIGSVPRGKALLRSTARTGDDIWVSGSIGDAAFGLQVALGKAGSLADDHADWLLDRYRLPQPRLRLGKLLRDVAHAAMDVSDGLLGDLGHLVAASGLAAAVELARIPLSPAGQAALAVGLGHGWRTAVSGGDDYEILFTAPPGAAAAISAISAQLKLKISRIGCITEGMGVVLLDGEGREMSVEHAGYRHFAGSA